MHDVIIIGAGPAGLTSLLFTLHYGLNAIAVGDTIGGKLLLAPDILDYPGIGNISGREFIESLTKQLERVDGKVEEKTVTEIKQDTNSKTFALVCSDSTLLNTKTLILATGNGNKQRENSAAKLAQQLSLPIENGHIKIDENNMTTTPGIFAAGDCITFPTSLEQLPTATATGIHAAAGVYRYLKNEKPPILWGSAKIMRK